jgi:hypothetical protein
MILHNHKLFNQEVIQEIFFILPLNYFSSQLIKHIMKINFP